MAHNEKLVVKKVNLACLLIALVLTVLTIFAYTTLTEAMVINGVESTISTEEILEKFDSGDEDFDVGFLLSYIALLFVSIFGIVVLINIIRLVIGWFGFIGKKDSRRMAKKLAKHAKIAFGSIGVILSLHVVCALDDGIYTDAFATLAIITGIVFVALFLAVRYYRWFVVQRLPLMDYLFTLIRDVASIAVVIILTMTFVNTNPIGDIIAAISRVSSNAITSDTIVFTFTDKIFEASINIVVVLGVLGVMRKTLKFLAFDNYKKPTCKRVRGILITTFIISTLFMASMGLTSSINNGGFDVQVILASVLDNSAILIQLLVSIIGMYILASVGTEEERDVVIAAPVAAAPVGEAPVTLDTEEAVEAEAVEAAVVEEAVEAVAEAEEEPKVEAKPKTRAKAKTKAKAPAESAEE